MKVAALMISTYVAIVVGSAFVITIKNEGDKTVAQVLYNKFMNKAKCTPVEVEVTKTEGDFTWADLELMCAE